MRTDVKKLWAALRMWTLGVLMLPLGAWAQELSTMYSPHETAIPEGTYAYAVTGVDNGYVELSKIEETIPAGSGVLVSTTELLASGTTSTTNYLEGTSVDQMVAIESGYSYYLLSEQDGSYVWNLAEGNEDGTFYVEANKAYLQIPTEMANGYTTLQFLTLEASGTCGENLTWELTSDGELIISGTGEMYDYEADSQQPWYAYTSSIKKATIKEGVTSIGNRAFWGCPLTEISISEGVESLGDHAFYGSGLTSIVTPKSLTEMGDAVFYNCGNLVTAEINEGMTSMPTSTFYQCGKLSSVILPSSITNLQWGVFFGCGELRTLTCLATTPPSCLDTSFMGVSTEGWTLHVPDASVSAYQEANMWNAIENVVGFPLASGTCGDNLTWKLTYDGELIVEGTGAMTSNPWWDEYIGNIKKVTLKEGVTSIAECAFCHGESLASVSIPESVTEIGWGAFKNCGSLTSVTIPEGITSIGEEVFSFCTGMTEVNISEGVTSIGPSAFMNCFKLSTITIPEKVTSIGSAAFASCSSLTSMVCKATTPPVLDDTGVFYEVDKSIPVYVPASSVDAYKAADGWSEFTNILPMGTCGDNLTWKLTEEYELIVEGTGEMTSAPWLGLNDKYLYNITKATLKEGVTSIAEAAFHYCTSLASISIPETVTSIGNHAFRICTSLTSVTIPEGVTSIGKETFQTCTSLTEINIPENVTSIGTFAFENCKLSTITIPEKVTSIGSFAFDGCSSLTSMVCKATTPPVLDGTSVFGSVDKSIPVYVPAASVDAYKAADGWSEFTNIQPIIVIIESGTCGDNLTWKLSDVYKLTIEGTGEMYNYSNDSAAPWQNYKSNITSVDIKDGVTGIGSWAFSGCSNLTEVSMSETVTSIGSDAFRECSILEEITLPANLTEMGTGVFLYCSSLKSITVPDGVTKIGSDTFEFCPELASITFPAGLTEIGPWALKGAYGLASITCKATTPPTLGSETFAGVNTEIPVYVPTSAVEAYKAASTWNLFANIQPIILGSGTCGDNLTWKLTDDGELTISGTGTMNDTPWRNYRESIKKITIAEGVTSIVDMAFEGCSNVTSVTIPASVTSIGWDVFWDCTGELYMNGFPEQSDMMMGGFYGNRFTKVTIAEGVEKIPEGAFEMSRYLTTVVLPESLTEIGRYTFYGCNSLVSITIPKNVATIGEYTFCECYGLQTIVSEAEVAPSCSAMTFSGVNKGIAVYVPLAALASYESATGWNEFTRLAGTGDCGDNVIYKLYANGQLVIEGTGAMTTTPWEAYKERVKEVTIEEGVTAIANGAFAGCANLIAIRSNAESPQVCTDAFDGVDKNTPVYVPKDAIATYQTTDGWKEFTYIVSLNSKVILDGLAEFSQAEDVTMEEIIYVRNLPNTLWNTLYVPFEIPVSILESSYDVAYINDVHSYDTDDNGTIDEMEMEVIKITEGTLNANHPYLIRAKNAEAQEMKLVVTDATLCATATPEYDCSSLYTSFTFCGTYQGTMGDEFVGEGVYYAISADGTWNPIAEDAYLNPFRVYMYITTRPGSPVKVDAEVVNAIRIRVIGENEGEGATAIDNSQSTIGDSEIIYDLMGRRIENPTKGVYIINGKKVILK